MMKTPAYLVLILMIFTGLGCSSDDAVESQVQVPNIQFAQSSFTTTFRTAGATLAPNIDWNGEQGTLTLATPVSGVSLNQSTGVISWSKLLPIGTTTVQLIASNSAGQSQVTLNLENDFEGSFVGAYGSDPDSQDTSNYFQVNFSADGSVEVIANDSRDVATGTYGLVGSTLTAFYSYDFEDLNEYTFQAELVNTAAQATVDGLWYIGDSTDPADAGGYFEVSTSD
ncbi:hypothetical protein [Croceiramulus getboli]|nr:hypothetical protein P8624_03705 [Flavobacteriaceae bacterium YJPT1-3]